MVRYTRIKMTYWHEIVKELTDSYGTTPSVHRNANGFMACCWCHENVSIRQIVFIFQEHNTGSLLLGEYLASESTYIPYLKCGKDSPIGKDGPTERRIDRRTNLYMG